MKRYQSILVALATAWALLASASPVTARVDETTGGPVTGVVRADDTYRMGWCAVSCLNDYDFGEDSDGAKLRAPDYYPIKTEGKGDYAKFAVADPDVATGTYKIAFYGVVAFDAKLGYLKRNANGSYRVVGDFDSATYFSFEAEELDLGTLELIKFPSSADAYSDATLYNNGGAAGNTINLVKIPRGVKVVIRSYGCGKLQTTKVVRRAGTYKYNWSDSKAYRHYSPRLRLQVSLERGSDVKNFPSRSWSVKKFRWHC